MTGSELRRIRNSLELSRVAFGHALGYRGENVGRTVRRLEAGERKITVEVAEIATKLWNRPSRHTPRPHIWRGIQPGRKPQSV
jgi:hypothetical protein